MSDGDSESKPEVDLTRLKRRVGEVIKGKWTLERLLGVGGMAAVYAAKHEIGRRDALKILHPHVASDAEMVARFTREAKAANRFSHPGAVEVRDVDETDEGEPFMVMELLEGGSLARRIRKEGKVSPDEGLRIAAELLDVLAVAHAEGVIHRDIKPSNVFIAPDGQVKLLDFGIARIKSAGNQVGRHGTLVTDAGTTLGTVAYMPPEQLRTSDVDARADLYALGATLFRALSSERTHDEEQEAKLAQAILTRPARSLAEVLPDIHPRIVAVVDRVLQREPDARYPDAATMKADVDAVIDGRDPPFAMATDGPVAAEESAADDELAADVVAGATVKMVEVEEDPTTVERAANRAQKSASNDDVRGDETSEEDDADVAGGVEATLPMATEEADGASDPAPGPPGKTLVAEVPSPGLTDGGEAKTKVAKSVIEDTPGDRGDEPAGTEIGTTVGWVIAAAVVLSVVYVVYRANNDELVTPPIPMGTSSAPGPPSAPAEPEPPSPEPPSPEPPSPEPTGGGGEAASQPEPQPGRPGASPRPGMPKVPTIPSTLPTALPSGFPPLPKGFPTALPGGIPTALPPLPQPPPPAPDAP